MANLSGIIIKGIGGFYYVQTLDQNVYECRARGKFRLEGQSPLVGDRVLFEADEEQKTGYLLEIAMRKNELLRPSVANIDQLIVVLAASKPKPDFLLCDKMLIQAERAGIKAAIAINKCDEAKESLLELIKQTYKNLPYPVLEISSKTGYGMEKLKALLFQNQSCFAGQSAVGKSSLINKLCSDFALKIGGLSKKTDRGRHTTREITLLKLDHGQSYVLDTPGFSFLDIETINPQEIAEGFAEIKTFAAQCQFASCLHDKEPVCAVKEALERGEISQIRYKSYCQLVQEQLEKEKNKYR